ncbi:MAG TPA: zinc ribbon domain-containing protein [Candidatus Bathyarchaeia archaeon]|nr:zinc ribbon domain-containing protein [Candidatus Bathyarchaeia archaeon]
MAHIKAGEAVSTGVGLGLGLAISSYMFQALKQPESTAKPLVVCLNCRRRNSMENKYCWQCGQSLYPLPTTQCAKCKAKVPSMKYCGNCGAQLRKVKQKKDVRG